MFHFNVKPNQNPLFFNAHRDATRRRKKGRTKRLRLLTSFIQPHPEFHEDRHPRERASQLIKMKIKIPTKFAVQISPEKCFAEEKSQLRTSSSESQKPRKEFFENNFLPRRSHFTFRWDPPALNTLINKT